MEFDSTEILQKWLEAKIKQKTNRFFEMARKQQAILREQTKILESLTKEVQKSRKTLKKIEKTLNSRRFGNSQTKKTKKRYIV
jgi:hypothetical protein